MGEASDFDTQRFATKLVLGAPKMSFARAR
jgi:hypothetical protein